MIGVNRIRYKLFTLMRRN